MSLPTSHNLSGEWHTPQRARVRFLRNNSRMLYRAIQDLTGIPCATCKNIYKASSS